MDNFESSKIKNLNELKIKLFADGALLQDMIAMNADPNIKGLTTNPTLMRKAGIKNYQSFALEVLSHVKTKPISFEVFSDDFNEMESQANEIASWGENVYVKIPITNTKGIPSFELISKLVSNNIKVNVTAIMTLDQVQSLKEFLNPEVPNYVSIFAGRIADTGVDPIRIIRDSLKLLEPITSSEVIWASPRELLNVVQANNVGCHIITATTDILSKLKLLGYDLAQYSLDTVKMFFNDASESGFDIS